MLFLGKTLVHGTVDLVLDMPDQSLARAAAGGGQLLCPLFLEARPQFRLPATFGTVPLVTGTQVLVEGAVLLACRGGDEVGDPHVDAHDGCIRERLHGHVLVVREGEPPNTLPLVELYAGVECSPLVGLGVGESFLVVGSEFDRHGDGLALGERADREPVIIGRLAGGLQLDDIRVGLNAGLSQGGHIPFTPLGLSVFRGRGPIGYPLLGARKILLVLLVGLCAVGAPGLGHACRLHDGHPLPALGERGGIAGSAQLVGCFLGTEQGHVLLAECQVHGGQGIKGCQFSRVDLDQADLGDGLGEALGFAWPGAFLSLLLLHGWDCFFFLTNELSRPCRQYQYPDGLRIAWQADCIS